MSINIDKRLRAKRFRDRLRQAMQERGETQSGLARKTGVDRSTISQLLTDDGARLPNAQVVGECATVLGVSSDWLLSLSERPEQAADLLRSSLELTRAPRALVDEQIFAWHQEATGYKIRHVPAGLPDMLKTREMLEWEYRPTLGRTTQQAVGASRDRLDWMRSSPSDYEVALPMHEVVNFANGAGYYEGAPVEIRRAQMAYMSSICRDFYPRLRVYLFEARRLYSAPVTIFGNLIAVIYLGQNYLAFRDTERVTGLTEHFDHLVREAEVTARQLPEYVDGLWDGVR